MLSGFCKQVHSCLSLLFLTSYVFLQFSKRHSNPPRVIDGDRGRFLGVGGTGGVVSNREGVDVSGENNWVDPMRLVFGNRLHRSLLLINQSIRGIGG